MKPSWWYECALWRQGYRRVAGVDEVGRGAWAGPIVAAAVSLTPRLAAAIKIRPWFGKVNDSKLLSPVVREKIFVELRHLVPWAVGVVSSKQIDAMGIADANRRAVALAVAKLKPRPAFVLTDYVAKLGFEVAGIPALALVDGDAKVYAIALASIVAKVHRDRLMCGYGRKYPGYGLAEHKGYGTALHARSLRQFGVLPIHRRTYRPVVQALVY